MPPSFDLHSPESQLHAAAHRVNRSSDKDCRGEQCWAFLHVNIKSMVKIELLWAMSFGFVFFSASWKIMPQFFHFSESL